VWAGGMKLAFDEDALLIAAIFVLSVAARWAVFLDSILTKIQTEALPE
jgi:hypothetical protein